MNVGKKIALAGVGAAGASAYRQIKSVSKELSPLRRYWEHHLVDALDALNEAAERGEELPLIFVALGDSAAQGLGASAPEEGYVPRVAAALKKMSGREVALLNISLSGATAMSVLGTQLPQLAGLRVGGEPLVPDVVILDIGGNDTNQRELTIERFQSVFTRVAAQLPAGSFIGDVPTFKPLKIAERASTIARIIREETVTHGHHAVALEELSEGLGTVEYMFRYHAPDMFHPNSPWYERWAQLFADAIADDRGYERVDMADVPAWEAWSV